MVELQWWYSVEKRKEVDIAVRNTLCDGLKKARAHLFNVMEEVHKRGDTNVSNAIKRTLEEIDIFSDEIKLSETGHKYPIFSTQHSINKEAIKKLIDYDSSMMEDINTVVDASYNVENAVLNGENVNIELEVKKIRNYITFLKNKYMERKEYLRGLK